MVAVFFVQYPGSGLSNPAGSEVDNSRAIVLHPSSRGDENGSSYNSNHNKKSIHRRDDYSTEAVMEVDNSSEERKHAVLKRKRYGSGLGNLGNTCFMNSTLQCLAHTQPLRQYFVSGEYENDLNRDNPLGTGGELATQFADLLSEMWGVSFRSSTTSSTSYGVVYPRNFKQTLGRHAEQFLGYDQHDSQELATYLLDALHEDTNRVTKKPYIEKPEQGEDESDDVAADKAWSLHLRREDSRVLENFMGQVKSRVQCPTEGCGRVSTTFDPFMYLSVPIPGATDRTIKIIFCPLEGSKHLMNIRLSKTASMSTLQGKVVDMWEKISGKKIATENLLLVDVWHHAFYSIYLPDEDVEKIRDVDMTYAYELQPAAEFELPDDEYENEKIAEERLKRSKRKSCKRFSLPVAELTRLNTEDEWTKALEKYSTQRARVLTLLHRKRGTIDARIEFYNSLESFLDECYRADEHSEEEECDDLESGQDTREKSTFLLESGQETHEVARFRKSFSEVTDESKLFSNVRTAFDVAALEFASKKFRQFTLELMREDRLKYKEGLTVQVALQMSSMVGYSRSDRPFASPLCLRLSPRTTVYQLREVLAECLPIKSAAEEDDDDALQDPTSENDETATSRLDAMQVVRQIPLTYEPKKYSAYRPAFVNQMGMLNKGTNADEDGPVSFASPDDENEKMSIAELIGQHGKISMHWPKHLCQLYFDEELHEKIVEANPIKKNSQAAKAIKVKDCIEKYCQMEQLEESEMWYCDRCKKHVRAWKQFHLYRTPPILIVHLKRFHYSAMSHRRDKIDAFIDFPLEGLDLTDDVMQYAEDCKPIYECYAVSNHYGRLGGGHYTAYAMSDDGVWCHFDDSRVTTGIDPKDVVSNAAYVLYYRRRDLALSQTPSKLPMPAIVGDFVQSDSMMEIDDDNNNNTNNNNKKVIVEDDSSSEEDVTTNNIGDNSDMTDVDKAFMEGPESFEKSFPSQ